MALPRVGLSVVLPGVGLSLALLGVGLSVALLGVGLSGRISAPEAAPQRSLPACTQWVHSGKQLA